jgi:hypothetical protein
MMMMLVVHFEVAMIDLIKTYAKAYMLLSSGIYQPLT